MIKKKICFDIDGVICKTRKSNYRSSKPIKETIKIINELYKKNYIIIFTSRYMGRNNENVRKAKSQGYHMTFQQLKKWGLNFHELRFGKPSYDIFIDDKSLFFQKNWHKRFRKILIKKS
tara:strand:- start:202 stop:558 length:357 start_codon:yes stop_codon:yes gene_type:complete